MIGEHCQLKEVRNTPNDHKLKASNLTVKSTDLKLISAILEGNRAAFNELYNLYAKDFFLTCLRYAKNRADAEDYLQDAFVTLYKDLKQFDSSKATFKTWARRVVVNVCLQKVRKSSFKVIIEDIQNLVHSPAGNHINPLEELSLKEMTALISNLPSGYRTVFNMHVIDGFSHQEIAEYLNITASTSRTQLMKAKKLLKKQMQSKESYLAVPQYG